MAKKLRLTEFCYLGPVFADTYDDAKELRRIAIASNAVISLVKIWKTNQAKNIRILECLAGELRGFCSCSVMIIIIIVMLL